MLRNRLSHFFFALAVCVCALLCPSAHAAGQLPECWLPVDEAGWTVLRPSPDSRIIYVSSSAGDDATGRACSASDAAVGGDPFRPAGPVSAYKTVRAGLAQARDGYPDWVLLRRGDAWEEPLGMPHNGRSASEPAVIAAWGQGPRPQLRLRGKQNGLRFDIHGGFHDIAVAGIVVILHEMDEVHNVHALNVGASDEGGQCRNVAIRDNVTCGAPVLFTRNPGRLHGITFARNMLLMPWRERPLVRLAGRLQQMGPPRVRDDAGRPH